MTLHPHWEERVPSRNICLFIFEPLHLVPFSSSLVGVGGTCSLKKYLFVYFWSHFIIRGLLFSLSTHTAPPRGFFCSVTVLLRFSLNTHNLNLEVFCTFFKKQGFYYYVQSSQFHLGCVCLVLEYGERKRKSRKIVLYTGT